AGVAEDAPSNDLHETAGPYLYFAYAQMPSGDITLVVETANEPTALAHAMNQAIKRFDAQALLYGQRTLRQQMDSALSSDRRMTATASALGFFSMGLMAAGLFGMLQYGVARRTRELGLRVALGATAGTIQRLILGDAVRIAVCGIPIGLGLLGALVWMARSTVLGISTLPP